MKLCMGCMNQMEDHMSVCPYCGFNEAELRQESYYLTPGTVVGGKYIVGKAMGYGGYTVTYLGIDAEKNRKVTIKEYLPSDFSTRSEGDTEVTIYSGDAQEQFEQGLTTFLNEANRIQQLHNPRGIMQVYDCVAENDTGYVISEYLDGKTLKQMMAEGKRFSPQEAKNFICEILEGLRQVHPLDIIHCDIAPETIFVSNTGEIKLLDFGATRYVTTANSKSLAIILKQGYAPEEQYRSQGVRGPWTDVYALAAVMYYMITGVVPLESVDRALVDELKEPSKLGIQIPANMENALMNALNVYQKDRTPSAEVFYQELNSVQVKRIQVKKQKYETGKFPAWAKVLVAGLLCVVVAGGVYLVIHPSNSRNLNDSHSQEVKAIPLTGMSKKQAEEELQNNKELKNTKLKVVGTIFNKDAQSGGEIWTQEPNSGEAVSSGVITVVLAFSDECKYEDLLESGEVNARSLSEKMGISSKIIMASDKDDAGKKEMTFGNLYSVIINNENELTLDELKNKKTETIKLSEITKITYYKSPYLYEKKLGKYVGKNSKGISFARYTEKKGKKVKLESQRPPCDEKYFSFSREEGYIVEQTKKSGQAYNSSKDDKDLFVTVKRKFSEEKNVKDLKNDLVRAGFASKNISVKGNGEEVEKVDVSGEGGKDYFTKKDTITIYAKEKPIPQVQSQSQQEKKPPTGGSQGNSGSKPKSPGKNTFVFPG